MPVLCMQRKGQRFGHGFKNCEAQLQQGVELEGHGQGVQQALDPNPAHSSDTSVIPIDRDTHLILGCLMPHTGPGVGHLSTVL